MPDDNVLVFPTQPRSDRDFGSWLSWVECELSILGHDIQARQHDWRGAYDRNLRPEAAAAEAARKFESS